MRLGSIGEFATTCGGERGAEMGGNSGNSKMVDLKVLYSGQSQTMICVYNVRNM